jgi:hypothetical protein
VQSFRIYYENSKLENLKSFIKKDDVLSINSLKDIEYFNDSKNDSFRDPKTARDSLNKVVRFVYNFDHERIEEQGVTSSEMFEIDEHTDVYLKKVLGKPINVYRDFLWAIRFKDGTNILIHTPNSTLSNRSNIGYIENPYDIDKNELFSKLSRLGLETNKLKWLQMTQENNDPNNKLAAFKKFRNATAAEDIDKKLSSLYYGNRPFNSRMLYDIFKDAQDLEMNLFGRKSFSYQQYGYTAQDDYDVRGEILEVKPEGLHVLWSKIHPPQAFKKAEEGDEIFIPFKDLVAYINHQRKDFEYDIQAMRRGEWG